MAELVQTCEHSTICVYLAGVRHWHIMNGETALALRGVRRVKPKRRDPRLPITSTILSLIHEGLQQKPMTKHDKVMLWAACTLAFFSFLQCSEFTQSSASSNDSNRHLSSGDVVVYSHEAPPQIAVKIGPQRETSLAKGQQSSLAMVVTHCVL